jgi:hypothetical protein
MRHLTNPAFNKFLLENGQAYPYSRLQVTRNSFWCKWVMLQGHSYMTGLVQYFPTLANSFSNGVLLDMIQSGEAKPMPLALGCIMDSMHLWGREKDIQWYYRVVFILSRTMDVGVEHITRDFVRNLISLQITKLIQPYYDVFTLGFNMLYNEWIDWFNDNYKIDEFANKPFCFRWVAIKSFDEMEVIINEVVHGIPRDV